MKYLHVLAFTLVVIGALNWGLIGLFDYNLVSMLFGAMPMVEKTIYILVGVSAVLLASTHMNECKTCMMAMKK